MLSTHTLAKIKKVDENTQTSITEVAEMIAIRGARLATRRIPPSTCRCASTLPSPLPAVADVVAATASSPPPASTSSFSPFDAASTLGHSAMDSLQLGLEGLHSATGLPWWATVVVATLGLRLSLFPFVYYNTATQHRVAATMPDVQRLWVAYREALFTKDASVPGAGLRRQLHVSRLGLKWFAGTRAIWRKHGAHPLRRVVPLGVQLPCFILFALTWRQMVGASADAASVAHAMAAAVEHGADLAQSDFDIAAGRTEAEIKLLSDLQQEGVLWFKDLTRADYSMALPAAVLSISYANIHFARSPLAGKPPPLPSLKNLRACRNSPSEKNRYFLKLTKCSKQSGSDGKFFPALLDLFQCSLIAAAPMISALPAGVFCFMGTSAVWGLGMGFCMRNNGFRRDVLGLPELLPQARLQEEGELNKDQNQNQNLDQDQVEEDEDEEEEEKKYEEEEEEEGGGVVLVSEEPSLDKGGPENGEMEIRASIPTPP